MSTPRVLVIGIDGATPELIEPWAEAGELPALSRLMQERVCGPLHAWPSMNSAAPTPCRPCTARPGTSSRPAPHREGCIVVKGFQGNSP